MTRTKRALLVGSSFSAAPIYSELKKRGLDVTVCGALRDDPCHRYADHSIYIDYSNRRDLLLAAEEGNYDFLVPTCNDYSYLSSCWVANKLGLPGFDSVEVTDILHTKDLFRNFTHSKSFKAPGYYKNATADLSSIPLPCLVKPVDAFSGRGVTKVETQSDLDSAVQEARVASRRGDYVIEQYVQGSLHSHSAFVRGGAIILDFFVDEFCTVYPYQVNCSNHPSGLSEEMRPAVRAEMQKLISDLQICDGLLHTQFIANQEDFWIIECMRRCPGDLYGQLIERSTGVDYTGMFVAPFLASNFPEPGSPHQQRPYGRHTISTTSEMVYFSYTHNISATDIEVIQLKESGQMVSAAPDDKLAILMFQFSSRDAMLEITPDLASMIHVNGLGESDVQT